MLNDILQAVRQDIEDLEKFVDDHAEQIDWVIDAYVLELFVWIPWLENRIRSHRLLERDIEAMSRKGYRIFDGNKGRFVKEIPEAARPNFTVVVTR